MIAAQTLLDHTHYQDAPHLHARPSGLPAHSRKDVLVEKTKQSLAEGLACIEVPEPDQEGRDVVPGFEIEPDILDADLAEHLLGIAYLPDVCLVKIGRNRAELPGNGPKPAHSPDSST